MESVLRFIKLNDRLIINKNEILQLEKTNGFKSNVEGMSCPPGTYITFKNKTKIFVEQDIDEVLLKIL